SNGPQDHQPPGDKHAAVKAFLRISTLGSADEEVANNRGDGADHGDHQRQEYRIHTAAGVEELQPGVPGDTEDHRRDNRPIVRLEQVGPHTRNVADVVAHVVGDGGGIQRVVFGDAGFDFT